MVGPFFGGTSVPWTLLARTLQTKTSGEEQRFTSEQRNSEVFEQGSRERNFELTDLWGTKEKMLRAPEVHDTRADDLYEWNRRGRRWVFTWNNPPDNWRNVLRAGDQPGLDKGYYDNVEAHVDVMRVGMNKEEIEENELGPLNIDEIKGTRCIMLNGRPWDTIVKFLVAEEEEAPSTGTKHIQGYVEFNCVVRYRSLRRAFPIYWDIAGGGREVNVEYCTKGGNEEKIIRVGEMSETMSARVSKKQGKVQMLKELIDMNWEDFMDKYPYETFMHGAKLLEYKKRKTRMNKPWDGKLEDKNIWIWGPARTGKSRWAHEQVEVEEAYIKMQNKWWDGYDRDKHKVVIIEDADPMYLKALTGHIKIWSDRYGFDAEIKGGSMRIDPGMYNLIVTSNHSMDDIWGGEDLEAIRSRFTEWHIEDRADVRLKSNILLVNNH